MMANNVGESWAMRSPPVAHRPISAEIRHDGQVHKVRTLQISVGIGKHYGGGMTEEEAQIDDGRLD